MRFFASEEDVVKDTEKIAEVGTEGMFEVGLNISALRILNLLKSFGRIFLVIERRQEAGLYTDAEFLHFGGVEMEIVLRKRTYPNKFDLTPKEVVSHGEFIDPNPAQEFSNRADTIIIVELATRAKTVMDVDIGLDVLRIGVHSAELIDIEQGTPFAYATKFDDRSPAGNVVPDRLLDFACHNKELAGSSRFIDYFETCAIDATQNLDAVEITIGTARNAHI